MKMSDVGNVLWGALRIIAGVALIILGILGLFLPFLQGIIFILLGLVLLGSNHATQQAKKLWQWIKRKLGEW